jgi:4-aminobutyrate aminotransferase
MRFSDDHSDKNGKSPLEPPAVITVASEVPMSAEPTALFASSAERSPLLPELLTALPGPKTQALIQRDTRRLSPSYTRGYPLSIERGEGAMVWDLDGNRFLDFCAGIAVCATGHAHPEVVRVIQEQASRFLHMSGTDFYYESMVDLADKLSALAPGPCQRRVYFGNSGTEAIEAAIKLARYQTKRPNIIGFYRSFHGRTMGALSVTASKPRQRERFGPFVPGVFHTHYPYHYRDLFQSESPEACAQACLDYIEQLLFKTVVAPEEVAAFLVEPVQGEGGYVVPPANFLPGLQALAKRYGILIISDEVQSGVGRTGKMWASEHFEGYDPDIVCSAKGLASGLPLSAVMARECLMTWPPGAHASTFGGNPLACVAGLKTLELVESGLLENALHQGQILKEGLLKLQQQCDVIGEVRGLGLMLGIELVTDRQSRGKNVTLRNQWEQKAFERGLLILGCGENSLRLSPPLVIQDEQSYGALSILEASLGELVSFGTFTSGIAPSADTFPNEKDVWAVVPHDETLQPEGGGGGGGSPLKFTENATNSSSDEPLESALTPEEEEAPPAEKAPSLIWY